MPAEYTDLDAVFSECGTYRYQLTREWGPGEWCAFVMLNPSKADGKQDDPTIRRCTGFARSFGFDGYAVVNLFALRETNPDLMLVDMFPVGPENDAHITEVITSCPRVFAAWGGTHPRIRQRAFEVRAMAARLGVKFEALKLSKNGIPCHPVRLRGDLTPVPYPHPGAEA